MSTLSVFLVIAGGTAIAASVPKNSVNSKSVKDNSLKGKDVKDGTLKGKDVKDGTLTGADVLNNSLPPSGPAGGGLAGTYPNPTIANNAVGTDQVQADSLAANDLAPDSVNVSEIATDGVGASEIASSAVGSSEVLDGELTTRDVGRVSGTFNLNLGSVGADTCLGANVDLSSFGFFDPNDPVVVMPGTAWAGAVSFNVEGTGTNSFIALKACNPTPGPIDPDGAGGGTYHFIAFNAP